MATAAVAIPVMDWTLPSDCETICHRNALIGMRRQSWEWDTADMLSWR